jgi:hypothetical protein
LHITKAAIPCEADLDEQTGSVDFEIVLFRALLQLNTQDGTRSLLACVYGSETELSVYKVTHQCWDVQDCPTSSHTQIANYVGFEVLTAVLIKSSISLQETFSQAKISLPLSDLKNRNICR